MALSRLFNLIRVKDNQEIQRTAQWPESGQEVEWMRARVEEWRADREKDASSLFDPADASYLILAVHVGTRLTPEIMENYRALRAKNTDLVDCARRRCISYSCSRVADPEDLELHAHRLGVDVSRPGW